jgi:hypothetical protein
MTLDVIGNVLRLHLAACEHVIAGRELALAVALEEQGFDGAGPTIAQEDERSRRGRRHGTSRRRFHARHCHMRASTAVALVPVRRR